MVIKGYILSSLVKKTLREIRDDRIPSLAAETAYYFFFSLFPLLLFLTPLLGVVGNGPALMETLLARLSATLPADALSLLRRTLGEIVTSSGGGGVMTVGALLAGWSGSNIFGSLMDALNVAYDVTETRPFWKRLVLRLACLAIAGVVVLLATLVFLDGERVAAWVGESMRLGTAGVTAVTIAEFLLAFALLVGLGVMLLGLLPNAQQRWWHLVVASLVSTVLWVVATLLFRLYVQNFGSFNTTYGTIGGVIALLSWMYYTMFVVLAGGELAAELHHGTGAIDPARGAIYLGRIVSESGPGKASMEKVPKTP
ncbi:MAG TPA: YihY/virulence factor BrkB family protein [Gemmatimonadaceae bacterium]|nr:YihY/virulence factor BrkB family protein [Gemmatimonadaceae bacterium]